MARALIMRLAPAVVWLAGVACVALSDAGTEGGKCFDDGACGEGLTCGPDDLCNKSEAAPVEWCDGKQDGDSCVPEEGKEGRCIPGPNGLFCATRCGAPGEPCANGAFCFMKEYDEDSNTMVLLCSKTVGDGKAAGGNCGFWNACNDGLMCVKATDLPRCHGYCLDDSYCDTAGGAQCSSVPGTDFKVCVQ